MDERTKQDIGDSGRSYDFVITAGAAGIVSIALGTAIQAL
jgi:hypothetical protein